MASHMPFGSFRRVRRPGFDVHQRQILGARSRQEDRSIAAWYHGALLLAVSDGMGGHPRGDEASALCIETLAAALDNAEPPAKLDDWPDALRAALVCADDAVAALGASLAADARRPGATLAALLIVPRLDVWTFVSVGDSHLYRLRLDGTLTRINQLHRDARGLLTSYVGGGLKEIDGVQATLLLRPGDTFLLATDGIDNLSEAEIRASLSIEHGTAKAASMLLELVAGKRHPHQDDATVLVTRVPFLNADERGSAGFMHVSR